MFVLFILGCSNGNSPENIAVEYTKAYHQCDFTKAMSFCSPKMRQTMQKEADFFMQQQLEKGVGKVNPRVSIIESEISKNIFAVPAVKGIEFGAGFSEATMVSYHSSASEAR